MEVLWIIVSFMVIISEFLLELFLLASSTILHLHCLLNQSLITLHWVFFPLYYVLSSQKHLAWAYFIHFSIVSFKGLKLLNFPEDVSFGNIFYSSFEDLGIHLCLKNKPTNIQTKLMWKFYPDNFGTFYSHWKRTELWSY